MKHILYIQYTNPAGYPPLEHSSQILADAGWQVLFFGTGAQGANALEFPPHPNIVVRKLQFCPAGWRQKVHYFGFGFRAFFQVLLWRPKWIYASDPLSCPIALALSFVPGLRVLYHEHDSPDDGRRTTEDGRQDQRTEDRSQRADGETIPGDRPPTSDLRPPTSGFQRFLLWSRKRVGREAELVVLPNEKRLELFGQATGRQKQSLCVYNCPRKEEVRNKEKIGNQKAESGKVETRELRLAFHGSINRERLPLAVLEAMSRFPGRVHLSVVGYETVGIKGYMAAFLQAAERLGLGNAVEFVGALPRHDIFEPASKCDVGLAFVPLQSGDVNMANMTGASNKPFDYLACGLALLVSSLPDWKKMFVEPGYGLACNPDDPGSITLALQWFIEHPEETRRMGERGRERILKEWNYETQFASVRTIINGNTINRSPAQSGRFDGTRNHF